MASNVILSGITWTLSNPTGGYMTILSRDENGESEEEEIESFDEFVRRLEQIPVNLVPYRDNLVVFLYPIIVDRQFESFEPIYYDINNFRTAADIVGAIDLFYKKESIEIDPELKRIILSSRSNIYEGSLNSINFRREFTKILGGPKFLNILSWNPGFNGMKMISPGIYEVRFSYD